MIRPKKPLAPAMSCRRSSRQDAVSLPKPAAGDESAETGSGTAAEPELTEEADTVGAREAMTDQA